MAIKRLQNTDPGTGQWLARQVVKQTRELAERRIVVEVHSVPGHMRVKGNEKVEKAAKAVAKRPDTRMFLERFISLTYVGRTVTERN